MSARRAVNGVGFSPDDATLLRSPTKEPLRSYDLAGRRRYIGAPHPSDRRRLRLHQPAPVAGPPTAKGPSGISFKDVETHICHQAGPAPRELVGDGHRQLCRLAPHRGTSGDDESRACSVCGTREQENSSPPARWQAVWSQTSTTPGETAAGLPSARLSVRGNAAGLRHPRRWWAQRGPAERLDQTGCPPAPDGHTAAVLTGDTIADGVKTTGWALLGSRGRRGDPLGPAAASRPCRSWHSPRTDDISRVTSAQGEVLVLDHRARRSARTAREGQTGQRTVSRSRPTGPSWWRPVTER
jgi:hypothetical protein